MNHTFKPSDRVAFSREWLRNTGNVTGPVAFLRGSVISVTPITDSRDLVHVQWSGQDEPMAALSANLILVSDLPKEPV